MNDQPSEEGNLEPIDIDSRPQSVVLSTRLDAALARELGALARSQGRRISDVLRDAAAAYLAEPRTHKGAVTSSFIELSSSTQTLSIGWRPHTSRSGDLVPEGPTIGAARPRTGAVPG